MKMMAVQTGAEDMMSPHPPHAALERGKKASVRRQSVFGNRSDFPSSLRSGLAVCLKARDVYLDLLDKEI